MKAILSADRKWGLGYQGRLLVSIPSDLRFFRETTMGHVVVMGRKTLATLPAGQPLKGRTNIILSRDPEWTVRGATVVHSIKELMEVLKPYEDDDIYVAGGGEIYRQLLPYCDTAYVTRIDMTYQADTFFEDLDESPDWEMVEEGDEQTCFDIEFYFTEYRRMKRQNARDKGETGRKKRRNHRKSGFSVFFHIGYKKYQCCPPAESSSIFFLISFSSCTSSTSAAARFWRPSS